MLRMQYLCLFILFFTFPQPSLAPLFLPVLLLKKDCAIGFKEFALHCGWHSWAGGARACWQDTAVSQVGMHHISKTGKMLWQENQNAIRMLSISQHSPFPLFLFFHLGVSSNCFCETSFLAAPHVRLSFWVCFVQLLAAPLAQIFSLQAVQTVKICQRHHKIIPFWSVALPTPADPSRVGLPKWKDPNMAARAAIHLRGKYEVGDLLGEGAIQKATSHRAVVFRLNFTVSAVAVSKDQKISNVHIRFRVKSLNWELSAESLSCCLHVDCMRMSRMRLFLWDWTVQTLAQPLRSETRFKLP